MTNLVFKNRALVVEGKVVAGDFVREYSKGRNRRFEGSWDELADLTKKHLIQGDFQPGTGSVDNDCILVNVPADNFFTNIIALSEVEVSEVQTVNVARTADEEPVEMRVIYGENRPASHVQIVCYRADLLDQDGDRTSDAEWEIVSVNAQPGPVVPMHPETMRRNANHDKGGTFRTYTDAQWADSYAFWNEHVYIKEFETIPTEHAEPENI